MSIRLANIVSFPRSAWERTEWPLHGPETEGPTVTATRTRNVHPVRYEAERHNEVANEGVGRILAAELSPGSLPARIIHFCVGSMNDPG